MWEMGANGENENPKGFGACTVVQVHCVRCAECVVAQCEVLKCAVCTGHSVYHSVYKVRSS